MISHFNREHVRNGEFPKNISKLITGAMDFRQKSDYDDFFIASKTEAKIQLDNAGYILELVEKYIETKINYALKQ